MCVGIGDEVLRGGVPRESVHALLRAEHGDRVVEDRWSATEHLVAGNDCAVIECHAPRYADSDDFDTCSFLAQLPPETAKAVALASSVTSTPTLRPANEVGPLARMLNADDGAEVGHGT